MINKHSNIVKNCASAFQTWDWNEKEWSKGCSVGFGRKGYYSVYLVVDNCIDYHWYRQDKGGYWSHKPGRTPVKKLDASGKMIKNPAKADVGNYKD